MGHTPHSTWRTAHHTQHTHTQTHTHSYCNECVYKVPQRTATGTNRAWSESPPMWGDWQLAHTQFPEARRQGTRTREHMVRLLSSRS